MESSKYTQNPLFLCNSTLQFSSVQPLSRVRLFATPWIAAHQASLSITNSRNSLKLMCIDVHMCTMWQHVHSYLIFCCPLLLLPPIPPSIRVFSNESALHMRWPKYWSFSFSISPSNEHPELISFRMDWLDLLAVQGTLKSLVQHHSSKASLLNVPEGSKRITVLTQDCIKVRRGYGTEVRIKPRKTILKLFWKGEISTSIGK